MTTTTPTHPLPARPAPSRLRRYLKRLALFLLTLYALLLILIFFFHFGDFLIYHPNTQPMTLPPNTTPLTLTYPFGTIAVFTSRAPLTAPPDAYILSFPGNDDRAEHFPAYLAAAWHDATGHPIEAWSANLPGSGASTGPALLNRIAPLALATYDALALRAHHKPIFLDAASLGTTAALVISAHRSIAGAILRNPPPLVQLVRGHHAWWNLGLLAYPTSWMIPSSLDSITNATHSPAPATFVLSAHDETIPPPYHALITTAYAGPHTTILLKDASHNSPLTHPENLQLQSARATLFQNAPLP